jgi:hypothetical protein
VTRVGTPASARPATRRPCTRPRPGHRRRALGLAAAAALLVGPLEGCSRAVDVAAVPVVGADTAAGQATAVSGPDAGIPDADPVGRLRAGLLSPADLGGAWRSGDPPVPDPAAPAPCGGPGTVARFPEALRVGSTVVGPAGAVVQEALSVYADADTAQAAYRAGVAGLGCTQGTLHGAAVTIAAPQDLQPDVGGDRAGGWQVGSDSINAVLVLVQARQAVFAFAYVTPADAAPADRPDPRALTRAAVARALAA